MSNEGPPSQFTEPWLSTQNLLLKDPTVPEQLEASWADLGRPAQTHVLKMSDDKLRDFVRGVLAGHLFVSTQVRSQTDLRMVFLPVALGAFANWTPEALAEIGVLYAEMSTALPRSINGNPIFPEFRVLHKDDWKRASLAINAEIERQKHIPI